MIVVVSTGLRAPTRHLCEASVRAQTLEADHIYIESDPDVTVLENVWSAVKHLPPHTIVVSLDGDDWFAHARVMERVVAMHERGALVTYGSYITSDGEPGICQAYLHNEYRREPWYASHLKTWRAGLLQQLLGEYLQHEGKWIPMASDQALMIPLMELAGPEHVTFCEETLYIYNKRSSHFATADDEGRAEEQRWAEIIRAKPRAA